MSKICRYNRHHNENSYNSKSIPIRKNCWRLCSRPDKNNENPCRIKTWLKISRKSRTEIKNIKKGLDTSLDFVQVLTQFLTRNSRQKFWQDSGLDSLLKTWFGLVTPHRDRKWSKLVRCFTKWPNNHIWTYIRRKT